MTTITATPTNVEKIAKLPWSIASNAANTVFVQFTFFGSVFVLFLDQLGLSKAQIGFLLSLLPFFGLSALFIAPMAARRGYKRIFLIFYSLRKVITVFLLFTPWVLSTFGPQTALIFVSSVVTVFALCRSVAETARFPWVQEYVPNAVRGKYSATNNVFSTLIGFIAVTAAGAVIGRSSGLDGFMILIGIGLLFGLGSTWAASRIPGGAAVVETETKKNTYWDMLDPAHDKNFLFYLFGAGFIILAITPLNSFVPLFMQEQVGLSSGSVVWLQNGALLGGMLSTYLWGWAADRYGSKPVMSSGVTLMILLPILWMLMPRQSEFSLYAALGIAFLKGMVNMGWNIGSARFLFVNVVPPAKKTAYMALYYAWVGTVGGLSQLLGGQILDLSQGIRGQFLMIVFDPYTTLFVLGIAFPIISLLLLRRVQSDEGITTGEFAGLFFRGNPFLAMGSLIGYHLAKDERAVVSVTERLGQTRSGLAVDELLESLTDPRFNVRFEAIISIARTRPDPRLTEALVEVLHGTELSLTVVAAWALGRIGDERALKALRESLNSDYRSIRAHSARALGTLGDREIAPLLLERLKTEEDKGLQMAYASTLGKLRITEATEELLELLRTTENERARMSLALALARLVGDEGHFTRLLRQVYADAGTTTAQALTALRRKMTKGRSRDEVLLTRMSESADMFARNDLAQGATLMSHFLPLASSTTSDGTCATILQACAARLDEYGDKRIEYLILALHVMQMI